MRDLIDWFRLTRVYIRRGWPVLRAARHAKTLVDCNAFR